MKRYQGGEVVAKGVYLNLANWEYTQLYGETRVLPGGGQVKYLKVPGAVAVVMGPFTGLAFIIFLPLVGIIGLVSFLAYKVGGWALALGHRAWQPVVIGWRPGRAYLVRKNGATAEKKLPEETGGELANTDLTELEEEITRRRQQEER